MMFDPAEFKNTFKDYPIEGTFLALFMLSAIGGGIVAGVALTWLAWTELGKWFFFGGSIVLWTGYRIFLWLKS